MKVRKRARLLHQRLHARVTHYATEDELFVAVREHRKRMQEEAFLRGITTSGAFTLEAIRGMYSDVKRLPEKAH